MTRPTITRVLQAVPDPMLLIDAEGAIAAANGAAEAMFGAWILGRDHGTVLRHPALLAQIEAAVQGARQGAGQGQGAEVSEAQIERTDSAGTTRHKVRIQALAQGGARQLLLHFNDVTHLGEAEEMRRDFVANVSHELRTPLTSLIGFVETLRGPAKDDAEARARFLGIMAEEAQRMDRLIGDLLSLSRVEATERRRPEDRVEHCAVVRDVVATLTPRAQATGNTFEFTHDDAEVWVLGDRDQLTQVALNLTENALKYGGEGRPVTLRLHHGHSGKAPVVCLDVTDQGPGIASQHLPRLTERFYRVDTHRSRDMGGTGLGLAIVKHIVNRHRGKLVITSVPGQGSTFCVQLPPA